MSKFFIVTIEDNPGDVELLRLALDRQKEPYQLMALPDGAEALRFIYDHHAAPDPEPCAILLDLHLPKYDGWDVLAAVRREPRLRYVPVVMLTSGFMRPEEYQRIQSLGATFREKPKDFAGVLQLGTDVLDLCRSGLAASSARSS